MMRRWQRWIRRGGILRTRFVKRVRFLSPFQKAGIDYTCGMKRILLTAFVLFAAPVWAADDSDYTIKVIGDDGSVQVLDLRKTAQPPVPEALSEPAREVPAVEEKAAPVREEAKVAPEPTIERMPVEEAVVKTPAPKKSVAKKVAKKAAPPPPPPEPKVVTPPPMPVQRQITTGSKTITRGRAIAIALDYAPPSSDVEVFLQRYENRDVLAVVFKVEGGFHEVLIDPDNGTVLESRASEAFGNTAKPGHLSAGFR